MQMIHPIPVELARPARPTVSIEQRAVESKVRARQRQLLRTLLALTAAAIGLFTFVTWRRDTINLEVRARAVQAPMLELQARFDELGFLPSAPPPVEPDEESPLASYAGYAERFFAVRTGGPAIIAVSHPITLILRSNGRYAIIYQDGKLHSQFMTDRELRTAMADQLERMKKFEAEVHAAPPALP
jgi:hypothetical protein